jgi:poly-gamma-glutamate capsule biosynthesis protein CapA/YwtB (metallophosphatase superfamily)
MGPAVPASSQPPELPGLRRASSRSAESRSAGSRTQQRSDARAQRRRQARRQSILSVCIVVVLAGIGGYALLATKARRPGQPAGAGQPGQAGQPGRGPGSLAGQLQPVGQKPAATVTITWVGDMTFGTLNDYPPTGLASLLGAVDGDLPADLTVGNLETALGDLPMSKCRPHAANCYAFEAPDATAQALRRAGFSAVNVANNHTLDAGQAGETSTDDALRAAGLKWGGRPGQITYLVRNGIRIALLGFAPWSYDADALDIPAAEALVREARKHAQLVIVMEHLGGEGASYRHVRPGEEYFLGEDRGNSIAFSHGVIDAGADLVMGSGPHVLRGFQWYHGHLIAYSLGNFCGYNTLGLTGYASASAILHVTLNARGGFVRGSITPLRLVAPGIPAPDPARTAISYINALSQDDFAGNGAAHVSAAGQIARPAA